MAGVAVLGVDGLHPDFLGVGYLVHHFLQDFLNTINRWFGVHASKEPSEDTWLCNDESAPFIGLASSVATPDPKRERLSRQYHAPAPVFTQHFLNRFPTSFQFLSEPICERAPIDPGIGVLIFSRLNTEEGGVNPDLRRRGHQWLVSAGTELVFDDAPSKAARRDA
jgi:hypothetical protein